MYLCATLLNAKYISLLPLVGFDAFPRSSFDYYRLEGIFQEA